MKVLRFWLSIALLGFLQAAEIGPPPIHHDVAVFAAKDRLDHSLTSISVETVFDDLQFVKADSGFQAEYQLSAIIYQGKDQVDGKTWKQKVTVGSYDRTNSRNEVDLAGITFDLPPGEYRLTLTREDYATGKSLSVTDRFRVEDFSRAPLALSDISFARRVEMKDGRVESIVPEVTNPYKGLASPSFAYFEVYAQKAERPVEIHYEITGEKSGVAVKRDFILPLQGLRTAIALPLPIDSLQHDGYRLAIKVSDGNRKAETKKEFFIRWPGLPRNAKDLNLAIQQLQIIASPEEWKKLKRSAKENQVEAFSRFWAVRDPSPGTEYNEAMEAYYQRINYANETFTVMGREGWRTDRGLVFIILGPPDEVIRNDYPSNSKPYQIWQYYSINRQFQFFDRSGYGDYELLNPVSLYELQRFIRW
ncbi:MAG: GWxTD domain-containing protein [candidate division KSB1 bacterium]|nr:GWxTD domain-containing protein [candidate division KSB1 bacterium]MDZ7346212.1 GWxTD domain-containing protein [candidate division KSB1 bacterium]